MAKPKHKYAAVCASLPKLGLDPARRDVVLAAKAEALAPRQDGEPAPLTDAQRVDLFVGIKQRMAILLRDTKRSVAPRAIPDAGVYAPAQAADYARAYVDARDVCDFIDALESDAYLLKEVMQMLMVDQMEQEGIESLSLAIGKAVDVRPEPYAKVVDPERFRKWCVEQGLQNKMALPWATTNMLLKDRLVAGEPEPDGVEAKSQTIVTLRTTK